MRWGVVPCPTLTSIESDSVGHVLLVAIYHSIVGNVKLLRVAGTRKVALCTEGRTDRSVVGTRKVCPIHSTPTWVLVGAHLVVVRAAVVAGVVCRSVTGITARARRTGCGGPATLAARRGPGAIAGTNRTARGARAACFHRTAPTVIGDLVRVALVRITVVIATDFTLAAFVERMGRFLVSPGMSILNASLES
mgnify:CR=1 FL=1